jgi:coenzyme F420 hydrogenase subunit beta
MFAANDLTPELGAVKGLYLTRAADESIRENAQHGGTVSALMKLAMAEGVIDTAILANGDDRQMSATEEVDDHKTVGQFGLSKFMAPPTIGKVNQAIRGESKKVGVVALPCQAQAIAKMKQKPAPGEEGYMPRLPLVIGLFCGWAFDWEKLDNLLRKTFGEASILKMDIPPSDHQCMEVETAEGMVCIPMDDIQTCVAEGCQYCFDMTCEFSDISVGAARSKDGWDVDKGWNQLIVRTEQGQQILEMARKKGVLEFRDVPDGNLDKLKKASIKKKQSCLKYLSEIDGSDDDLVYLSLNDAAVCNS